jgi:4-hydroxybenzoate polyprenyltransferase
MNPAAARALFELARPAQWIKNGFVLLPVFFARAALDGPALAGALLATLAFCLASSAVYAGNDAIDAERDRLHPDKRRRPVARGAIGRDAALRFGALLAASALLLPVATGRFALAGVLAAYLLLQVAYSLLLKRIAWIDSLAVAGGFVLRLVAGGVGAQVPLTPWIVLLGFVLALMLVLGKRHGDLVHARDPRAQTTGYRRAPLERVLVTLAVATLACYAAYVFSPEVLARHGHRPLMYSTPWVLLGVLRYLWLVLARGAGGDPSRIALRDPVLLLAASGWIATLAFILYGP